MPTVKERSQTGPQVWLQVSFRLGHLSEKSWNPEARGGSPRLTGVSSTSGGRVSKAQASLLKASPNWQWWPRGDPMATP